MSAIIPWGTDPAFEQTVLLSRRPYVLRAKWNVLHEYWTLDIEAQDGTLLLAGAKLVLEVEILRRFQRDDLPPGFLLPVAIAGSVDRIGRNSIGQNVSLVYFEPEEILA